MRARGWGEGLILYGHLSAAPPPPLSSLLLLQTAAVAVVAEAIRSAIR